MQQFCFTRAALKQIQPKQWRAKTEREQIFRKRSFDLQKRNTPLVVKDNGYFYRLRENS